jgi:predicted translation initiation factor SUI1
MKLRSFSDLEQLLPNSSPSRVNAQKFNHDGKGKTVHIFLDTKGRKGKRVTIVAGLHHNPATMEEIERILKQYCGAGGTLKEGNIEIQGDQRDRVAEKMKELNYVVKG